MKERKRSLLLGREVARYHDHYNHHHYAALYRLKQIDFLNGRGWRSAIAISSAPGCRYDAEPNGLCTFDRWNCFGFPLYLSLFPTRRASVFLALFHHTKNHVIAVVRRSLMNTSRYFSIRYPAIRSNSHWWKYLILEMCKDSVRIKI